MELTPGQPLDFHWEGHGLKLHIPADVLTLDTPDPEPITMTIRASINGQFLLPSDLELVSGIYWVSFSKHFSKPVTLSVQHCCNLEDPDQVSSLCFIAAKCSEKKFNKFTGNSSFPTESCCGTIKLQNPSVIGIGQLAQTRWNGHYAAHVYTFSRVERSRLIRVPVIRDLDIYGKVGGITLDPSHV